MRSKEAVRFKCGAGRVICTRSQILVPVMFKPNPMLSFHDFRYSDETFLILLTCLTKQIKEFILSGYIT